MLTKTSPVYFITAASGTIGQQLVPLLLSQPFRPTLVLPTSDASRLTSQLGTNTQNDRIKTVQGDIKDPVFVEAVAKSYNVTAVFICITGEDELFVTLNILDALTRAHTVKHLVYLSGCGDYDLGSIRAGLLRTLNAGHIVVKAILEAKLRYGSSPRSELGGFSWTILGPTLFFTNDLHAKQNMLDNAFFDEPLGSRGVSRADPQDIALAVSNALEDDGRRWGGKKVMIGSLKMYTNNEVAKLWTDALGFEVTAARSDAEGLEASEQRSRKHISAQWARDIRLMYEWFEVHGFGMTEKEYEDQILLLGKVPASYEEFVKKTADEWRVRELPRY
ncbi:uncharacterized protein FOBCDRAFT_204225 [Fusarium oxysporum Fo47]|uniref:NAD(P)-binding domain-containing protein n=1 Tax=Fusarium oxysporum Fo47 TaxID=660027 RepID=W9JDP6_FUSOX|nr:uncharacterized protein FOBCDRAFT_204225 [Fusarium oxysporum Fo47]EWZ27785.1 hypothetical protein FOZG_18499 [Fusarium oxysporum Fo47]QKD57250.1 hypothetical protein FOBCDRAFT_204225 [Fusarium oxysporum Fo47]